MEPFWWSKSCTQIMLWCTLSFQLASPSYLFRILTIILTIITEMATDLNNFQVVPDNHVLRFVAMITSSNLGLLFLGLSIVNYSQLCDIYSYLSWCGLNTDQTLSKTLFVKNSPLAFTAFVAFVIPCFSCSMENINSRDWSILRHSHTSETSSLLLPDSVLPHIRNGEHSNVVIISLQPW